MYPAIFGRTYPLSSAAEVFAAAARDGYRGVQFNLLCAGLESLPEQLPEGFAESVDIAAKAAGIRIAALSGTYNMAHPDANIRESSRRRFANVVEAARRMGAPVVTLCTGSRDPDDMWKHHPGNQDPEAWNVFRGELDEALAQAVAAGIKLAIEPEPGNVVNNAERARRLLDEVRSPALGIVLDAANLLSPQTLRDQYEVVAKATQLLAGSILLAHAKDIDSSGNVAAAGKGAVDLAGFVAALDLAGYRGALIGHGFSAGEAPQVAKVLAALLAETPENKP